jgi:RNA polymerase sigma-54 factor
MVQQSLEIKQSQSLVMTQQLRQSIELLQLSSQELQSVIEAEMEKNPLLSEIEEVAEMRAADHDDTPLLDMEEGAIWGNADSSAITRHEGSGDYTLIEQRMTDQPTLSAVLTQQLQHCSMSLPHQKMAEAVIDMLDSAGYLPLDYTERLQAMGAHPEEIEIVIQRVQECEPTGVAARNLQECLSLQLKERGQLDAPMQQLLAHLPLIAEGNSKKLCRLCGLDPAELAHYIALIRACNPKPASDYEVTTPQTLIADVIVRRTREGGWEAELNQEILPKIMMDAQYSQRLRERIRLNEEGKAISEHVSHAQWLLKSLQQRHQTLYAVANAIVAQQGDFLEFGIAYLHPMTLKDIAIKVGCHESTVSRITTQKYMATERGIFELKYFFTSTLQNANGGSDYSSRSVMHAIEQMIKLETSTGQVMSDAEITEELRKNGINVARRTVVKYRTQLGIPPSNIRKKAKNTL